MFFTYLRRELSTRKRQTFIVAFGMGLAIALVILVNALGTGVQSAQAQTLASVYGVGTDITVSQTATPGSGGPGSFDFGSDAGSTNSGGTRTISRSRLSTTPGTATLASSTVNKVAALPDVAAATGTLALENTTFKGELPTFGIRQQPQVPQTQGTGPGQTQQQQTQPEPTITARGGADGAGGSAFNVDRFSVLGVDPKVGDVGPFTSVRVIKGKGFTAAQTASKVALIDTAYATSQKLKVGSTISVGGSDVKIVGIVEATSGSGVTTGTDVYLPLATAQKLSGITSKVTTIYVKASSSKDIATIDAAITKTLPKATVSTQSDLASSITGSIANASSLVDTAGRWASIGALVAAFLLAILFTVSGVGRRTREFGTLKAIGWRSRRVVGQVAGESMTQGLLGGALGLALGLGGVAVINAMNLTFTGSATKSTPSFGPPGGFPGGGFPGAGRAAEAAAPALNIPVTAAVSTTVIVVALGLAILGGLLAGGFGGWRAARLSPAEALRAVG